MKQRLTESLRNIRTIFGREWRAYFTSPIGYIFLIVFLLVTVWNFIWRFFSDYPVADMRPFFDLLPFAFAMLVPAVSMRLWSEERKAHTFELLLTFPMRTHELVLGKFVAAVAFLAVALAGTLTIPIMLAVLGNPDGGVIVGSYFGALLLGSMFLALGLFFSALFVDQISAFVVTLLACLVLVVAGLPAVAEVLDSWSRLSLGTGLMHLLGVTGHYESFVRGVLEIKDVLFFLVWTGLFLLLNSLFIDIRQRRGGTTYFSTAVGLAVGVGLLFNGLFVSTSFYRVDLTEEGLYTLSDSARHMLAKLDEPVTVKLYITPQHQMPTSYKEHEREVVDRLEEMRIASGRRLNYKVVYLDVSKVLAKPSEGLRPSDLGLGRPELPDSMEKQLLEKGLRPFAVRDFERERRTQTDIFSGLGVVYRDLEEYFIPRLDRPSLPDLEYRILRSVAWLQQEKPPVVALHAFKPPAPPDVPGGGEDPYAFIEGELLLRKYDVRRFEFSQSDPIPPDADVLVLLGPMLYHDRQLWEINRWLRQGKPVLIAAQHYVWRVLPTRTGTYDPVPAPVPCNLDRLLDSLGLTVSEDFLFDQKPFNLAYPIPGEKDPKSLALPCHISVPRAQLRQDMAIANGVEMVYNAWGSAVETDADKLARHHLKVTPLMQTSGRAWTVDGRSARLGPSAFDPDQHQADWDTRDLMIMVEGFFPDAFEDRGRPRWPTEPAAALQTPEGDRVRPQSGRMILLGNTFLFQDVFAQGNPYHQNLLINSLDMLVLNPQLMRVRSRVPQDRTIIDPPTADAGFFNAVNAWRVFNLALVNLVLVGIGVTQGLLRLRRRHAYLRRYGSIKADNAPAEPQGKGA